MAIRDRLVPRYLKNVGRSLLYATGDVLKNSAPDIIDFTRESKDTIAESYNTIKEFVFSKNDTNQTIFQEGKSVLKQVFKNSLEDLKSGDWYNKSRDDQFENEQFKAMGFDFDFGDLDSTDEWGEGGESSSDSGSSISDDARASITSDRENTAATIRAVDAVGAGVAASVNRGIMSSSNYIVKSTQGMLSSIHTLNKTGFAQVSSSVTDLNKTFTEFATMISKPLSDHIRNSTEYYIKAEQTLNTIRDLLQKMVESHDNANGQHMEGKGISSGNSMADMISGGMLNLGLYKDFVKNQIKDTFSLPLQLFETFGGRQGISGMLKTKSIPRIALEAGVNRLIPQFFKDELSAFNDQFKYATVNALKKLSTVKSKDSFSPFGMILSMLTGSLIPNDIYNDKLDNSGYNKGPIPWDGKAKKALTEVIPTTLLKIYSAITNGPDLVYDYDKGAFVTRTSVETSRRQYLNAAVTSAGGNFRKDALAQYANSEKYREERQAIQDFFRTLLTDNSGKSIFELKDLQLEISEDADEATREYYENQLKAFKERYGIKLEGSRGTDVLRTLQKLIQSGKYNDFNAVLIAERERIKLETETINASGDHLFSNISNGSELFTGRLIGGTQTSSGGKKKNKGKNNTTNQIGGGTVPSETLDSAWEADMIAEEAKRAEEDAKQQEEINKNIFKDKDSYKKFVESHPEMKKGLFGKVFFDTANNGVTAWNSPFYAVTDLLQTITESINNFFWGTPKDQGKSREKGFFGRFTDKLDNTVKDLFGWDKGIKDTLKGFWGNTKASLKDIGKSYVDEAKQSWADVRSGYAQERITNYLSNYDIADEDKLAINKAIRRHLKKQGVTVGNDTLNAYGKEVTKTGMVAVSRGEMIIPSDYNPLYHGSNDKRAQLANEARVARRFYGLRAKGDTSVGNDSKRVNLVTNRDSFGYKLGAGSGRLVSDTGAVISDDIATMKESAARQKARMKRYDLQYGIVDKKLVYEMNKARVRSIAKDFQKGDVQGRTGAGGIIGAIGGSLLGLGPVAGLIAGAGIGFASKSEGLQKFLFGDVTVDENGKVKDASGNLLGAEASKFILQHGKSIGKGALAGSLLSMITPLGPIAGAVVGATAGYISSAEGAKEFLFGKMEYDANGKPIGRMGGLISKKMQNLFKGKNLARMGLGALAGLAIGPTNGLFFNLVLGAGAGLLTTTNSVRRFLFGGTKKNMFGKETHVEGLLPMLKRVTLDRILDIGVNLKRGLVDGIKDLVYSAKKRIEKKRERIQERLDRSRLVKHFKENTLVGRGLTAAAKWAKDRGTTLGREALMLPIRAAGLPFALGKAAAHSRQLRKGRVVYDSRLGRDLSASERLAQRDAWYNNLEGSTNKYSVIDQRIKQIAEATDEEGNPMPNSWKRDQLEKLKKEMQAASKVNESYDSEAAKSHSEAYDQLNKDFHGQLGLLGLTHTNIGETEALLRETKGLQPLGGKIESSATYKKLLKQDMKNGTDYAQKYKDAIENHRQNIANLKADTRSKVGDVLAANGINIDGKLNKRDFERFESLIASEQKLIGNNMTAEELEKEQEAEAKRNTYIQSLASAVTDDGSIRVAITDDYNNNPKLSAKDKEKNSKAHAKMLKRAEELNLSDDGHGRYSKLDADGKQIRYKYVNGDFVPDDTDKETAQEMVEDQSTQDNIARVAKATEDFSAKLSSIPSMNITDEEGTEGEEKSSWLTKLLGDGGSLKGLLFGDGGLSISNILSTLGVKGGISNVITKLLGGLGGIAAPLLLGVFTAVFIASNWDLLTKAYGGAIEATKDYNNDVDKQAQDNRTTSGNTTTRGLMARNRAYRNTSDADKSTYYDESGDYNRQTIYAGSGRYDNNGHELYEEKTVLVKMFDEFSIFMDRLNHDSEQMAAIKSSIKDYYEAVNKYSENKNNSIFVFSDYPVAMLCTKKNYGVNHQELPLHMLYRAKDDAKIIDAVPYMGQSNVDNWLTMNKDETTYTDFFYDEFTKTKTHSGITVYHSAQSGFDYKSGAVIPAQISNGNIYESAAVRFLIKNDISNYIYGVVWYCEEYNKRPSSAAITAMGDTWKYKYYINSSIYEVNISNGNYQDIPATYYPITKAIVEGFKQAMIELKDNRVKDEDAINIRIEHILEDFDGNNDNSGYIKVGEDEFLRIRKEVLSRDVAIVNGQQERAYYDKNTGTKYVLTKDGRIATSEGAILTYDKGSGSSGSGSGVAPSGGNSGLFVSQFDPKYANKAFGDGTIASSGCAPAVAAMVGDYYGKGLNMNAAISGARAYANSNGTSIDYFNNVFNKNGIKSGITTSTSDIYNSLKNGKPVVLLGENAANTSKDLSPFGPNAHYVMAKGIDSNGNIIVNDPEMNHSIKYSPQILDSVDTAVVTSGGASGVQTDDKMMKLAEAVVKTLANIAENTGYMKDVADNTGSIKEITTTMIDMASTRKTSSRRYAGSSSSYNARSSAVKSANSMVTSLRALAQG